MSQEMFQEHKNKLISGNTKKKIKSDIVPESQGHQFEGQTAFE